jgi:hypothetical protein
MLEAFVKIMGMAGLILLLMVIYSGFGIIKIGHIGQELQGIAEDDIPLTEAITDISEQVNLSARELSSLLENPKQMVDQFKI